MVPTVPLPPAVPLTLQFTVTGVPPDPMAVNACFPPRGTVAELGETEMAGGGGGGGGVELPPPQPAIVRNTTQIRISVHELRIEIVSPPHRDETQLLLKMSLRKGGKSPLRVVAGLWIEVVWRLVTRIHRRPG